MIIIHTSNPLSAVLIRLKSLSLMVYYYLIKSNRISDNLPDSSIMSFVHALVIHFNQRRVFLQFAFKMILKAKP